MNLSKPNGAADTVIEQALHIRLGAMKEDDFGPIQPVTPHYEYERVRTAWLSELNRSLELLNAASDRIYDAAKVHDGESNYQDELKTTHKTVLRAIQFAAMKDFPSATNMFLGVDKADIAKALCQSKKL